VKLLRIVSYSGAGPSVSTARSFIYHVNHYTCYNIMTLITECFNTYISTFRIGNHMKTLPSS